MSDSVDFGLWDEPDGRRGLLSWNSVTGQLVYHGHRYGMFEVARVRDLAGLCLLLDGWADHTTEGISWVWTRVAHLAPCPCCDGVKWLGRNWDGGERLVPCPLCNRVAG